MTIKKITSQQMNNDIKNITNNNIYFNLYMYKII